MKFASLKSVGHNIADSLASGVGLLVGAYEIDVFGEAAARAPGYIEVDFMLGKTSGTPASRKLRSAVKRYADALPALCDKQGVDLKEVRIISARFERHPVAGPYFTVTVESARGKRSVDQYVGISGRRLRRRQGEQISGRQNDSSEPTRSNLPAKTIQPMRSLSINLALRFVLELTALGVFGLWGWRQRDDYVGIVFAIGVPLVAATLWGVFAVPGDPSRSGSAPVPTPGMMRLALEFAFFACAVWAFAGIGRARWAVVFAAIVLLHYALSYDRIRWLIAR